MKNCWRRRGSSSKIQKITLKRKNTGEKFNIQLESGDSFNFYTNSKNRPFSYKKLYEKIVDDEGLKNWKNNFQKKEELKYTRKI